MALRLGRGARRAKQGSATGLLDKPSATPMRLLRLDDDDQIAITDDIYDDLPPYAILSHTWGAKSEEVTYQDIQAGLGKDKHRVFCCIDKSSSAELSEALNSMFRWYAQSSRCYVYLSDVPFAEAWESEFRKSRWFTRGWTLQELLAPRDLDFFTADGVRLGSRNGMTQIISGITGIPPDALHGDNLSTFSIQARMSWHNDRHTAREEDLVCSLLGLLNITMPPIYGEGKANAQRRLNRELSQAESGLADLTSTSALTDMPESSVFVGREHELQRMREELRNDGQRRYIRLTGLGGIGKTQLAVAYAQRFRQHYSFILWLDSSSRASFIAACEDIARHLHIEHAATGPTAKSSDALYNQALRWLCQDKNNGWLMVCDDYRDDDFDLKKCLPQAQHGHVIVTSRSGRARLGMSMTLALESLTTEQGVRLLAMVSDKAGLTQVADAAKLVVRLGGLPLALYCAGIYLRETGIDCAAYIRDLDTSWSALQKHSPLAPAYPRTLDTTWQSTYDRLILERPEAELLLELWTYLSYEGIWFDLLRSTGDSNSSLAPITSNRLTLRDHMSAICDTGFAIVEKQPMQHGSLQKYRLHPCIHAWLNSLIERSKPTGLAQAALFAVGAQIPEEHVPDFTVLQQCIFPHAARLATIYEDISITPATLSAFHKIGALFVSLSKHSDALSLLQKVLEGRKALLGEEDELTIDTMVTLGHSFFGLERNDEAQTLYQTALIWRQEQLGAEHKSTLKSMNNLANTFMQQKNYIAAEALYVRTIALQEHVLGEDDAATLDTTNNLALLYSRMNFNDKAVQLFQHTLAGYRRIFGVEHTATLLAQNNLGTVYESQGNLEMAETMYSAALAGRTKASGLDHVSTLDASHNLGRVLFAQNKLPQAETSLRFAVEGYERVLGPQHSSSCNALKNLGILLHTDKRLSDAEAIFQVLVARTTGQGKQSALNLLANTHKAQQNWRGARDTWSLWLEGNNEANGEDVLWVYASLGDVYNGLGDIKSAEDFQRRCLAGRLQKYGTDAELTTESLAGLAGTLRKQGKEEEASALQHQAYEIRKRILGRDHIRTIQLLKVIGLSHAMLRDWDQAYMLLEEVWQSHMRRDPDSEDTLDAATALGMVLRCKEDYAGAETLYEQALRGYKRRHGPDAAQTTEARGHLGDLYLKQKKWHEAKQLYQDALRIKEASLPASHAEVLTTVQMLALAHFHCDEFDDAERCARRVANAWRGKPEGLDEELHALQTLGDVYKAQGKLDDARDLWHICADRGDSVQHPKNGACVISSGHRLAQLYKQLNRVSDARAVYERTLKTSRRLYGDDHEYTLELSNNCAFLAFERGAYEDAERLYLATLSISEAKHGVEHILTLTLLVNLALLYVRQWRIADATTFYKRASPYFGPSPAVGSSEIREIEQALALAVRYDNSQIYDFILG